MNFAEYSTDDFTAREFRCKCSTCKREAPHRMVKAFCDRVQALREAYGKPLVLQSAWRCKNHPSEAKKRTVGQHGRGLAVDIRVTDGAMAYQIQKLAFAMGFRGIAYGEVNGVKFVHIDDRTSTPVSWTY